MTDLEIIAQIGEAWDSETAREVNNNLDDDDLGIIHDISRSGAHYLVRWPDETEGDE
ncbi:MULTISPECIES: hypothetical protein [Haloferax]|uniref:Uncharacterized protein n=3 Tax=Haloferax volcanii TaxID=2246 RepID=D4H010_HALVD|nr:MULTISPECIES: hypothetical protein [Haloferax]ADE04570.1 uncharacterized protein HVO_0384 [Haloferax volcanii DS2]ELY25049.1 hypothetical protein C498_16778 [Haloferax volcanii DS2]MBS8119028.1 hypothetical protein [Haloferax volcanii]MBS8124042.1 hypothetical protein [Haloferax volcanii]MBS8127911.1 hypothetical protein [Haloferax volcanii]